MCATPLCGGRGCRLAVRLTGRWRWVVLGSVLMRTTRLRVRLREVEPAVVRVIDVPVGCTLAELHELFQAALGWTDSHVHEFQAADGRRRFGVPDGDDVWDDLAPPLTDETRVGLRKLGREAVYLYDFGDGWTHDIEVLGPGGDRPGCVYGEGMCPPEDVGGPDGYAELLAVLADRADDQYDHLRGWAGELTDFDQASTDELIRRTVGQVPPSVRLVLELAVGGVKLTHAGRLPRVFVRTVQTHRPHWAWDDRPAMREEDLLPLAAMHNLLRQVGLLRLRHGVLWPTRAATDELQIIRRLRSYFALDEFNAIIAGVAVAALAHHGAQPVAMLAERAHPWVSPGWGHRDGTPVTHRDIELALHRHSTTLQALDLITTDRCGVFAWQPGPCATSLLYRAAALAHLWSQPRYRPNPDPRIPAVSMT